MTRLLLIALTLVSVATLTSHAAPAAPGGGKRVSVTIEGLKFRPDSITVEVGDTVVWTNADDREHTVTADDNSFNSGRLRKGMSFSKTFDKPGRYPYGSDPSPRTKGVVIVRDARK
jgi:plastocyanin